MRRDLRLSRRHLSGSRPRTRPRPPRRLLSLDVFVAGPLEAATSNKTLGFAIPKERERMVGYGSLGAVIDTLEAAVSRAPYIAGDTFTAADVYVGAQIGWGLMMGSIDRRPAFTDYLDRLGERPAFRRAREMDDAAARELGMTG